MHALHKMLTFLPKLWILLFGLQCARGIPIHEFLTGNIDETTEFSSPITPLLVLDSMGMGGILGKLLFNNFSGIEISAEHENGTDSEDTIFEVPETEFESTATTTENPISETTIQNNSKSAENNTDSPTMVVPIEDIFNSTEPNDNTTVIEPLLSNTQETKMPVATNKIDTTSENAMVTSTENVTLTETNSDISKNNETTTQSSNIKTEFSIQTESSQKIKPDFLIHTEATNDQSQLIDSTEPSSTHPENSTQSTEQGSLVDNESPDPITLIQSPPTQIASSDIIASETSTNKYDNAGITSTNSQAVIENNSDIQSNNATEKPVRIDMTASPSNETHNLIPTDKTIEDETSLTTIVDETGDITTTIIPDLDPGELGSGNGEIVINELESSTNKLEVDNITAQIVSNLTISENSSTTAGPQAPERHANGTINFDKLNTTPAESSIMKITLTTIPPTTISKTTPTPELPTISIPAPTADLSHKEIASYSSTTLKGDSQETKSPKENGASTPQTISYVLLALSFFYCHILM